MNGWVGASVLLLLCKRSLVLATVVRMFHKDTYQNHTHANKNAETRSQHLLESPKGNVAFYKITKAITMKTDHKRDCFESFKTNLKSDQLRLSKSKFSKVCW